MKIGALIRERPTRAGGDGSMPRVYPDLAFCMKCRLCEYACINEHTETKDLIYNFVERPDPESLPPAKISVSGTPEGAVPNACRHCEDPECVEACFSAALRKEPDGRVALDPDRCVACWSCIMACSYGVPRRDARDPARKRADKCDLCPDSPVPACVAICPQRALLIEAR